MGAEEQASRHERTGLDEMIGGALVDLVTEQHVSAALPLLETYVGADPEAAEVRALIDERYFACEREPWPELFDRVRDRKLPVVDLESAISDLVGDRLLLDLKEATAGTLRLNAAALKAATAALPGACRHAAREACVGADLRSVRQFQHRVCVIAWRTVVQAYAESLTPELLRRLVGGQHSAPVTDSVRTNLQVLAPAVRLGEAAHLRYLAVAAPVPNLFSVGTRYPPPDDTTTSSSVLGVKKGRSGGDIPFVDTDALAEQVLDELEPDEVAQREEDEFGRRPPLAHPGRGIGLRVTDESDIAYLERVDEFLRECIADAMLELRLQRERSDLVLDHITPEGKPDKDALCRMVRRLRLSGGGSIDARVRRAYTALQRLLSLDGFVLGEELKPGKRLDAPLVLPPGAPDPTGTLPPELQGLIELELRCGSLPAMLRGLGQPWPGPDGDWDSVRELLVHLRQARCAVREALDRNNTLCLFERGLVEPHKDLPARLRRYEDQGRPPIVPRPDPDPDAALATGRVIARPSPAVLIEEKTSWDSEKKAERALRLPDPLHKVHQGAWWYFPEGGVHAQDGDDDE